MIASESREEPWVHGIWIWLWLIGRKRPPRCLCGPQPTPWSRPTFFSSDRLVVRPEQATLMEMHEHGNVLGFSQSQVQNQAHVFSSAFASFFVSSAVLRFLDVRVVSFLDGVRSRSGCVARCWFWFCFAACCGRGPSNASTEPLVVRADCWGVRSWWWCWCAVIVLSGSSIEERSHRVET